VSGYDYHGRRSRLRDAMATAGVDAYVVSTPTDLLYTTGFDGIAALGPNPFVGGASAALIITAGDAVLCLPQQDTATLPADDNGLDVVAYPTFLELSPLHPRRLFASTFGQLAQQTLRGARVAYQPESLPVLLADELARVEPDAALRDWGDGVASVRMRKEPAEIDALRRSVAVCDAAQAVVAEMAAPGVPETAILEAISSCVGRLAGGEVPLIHEVTSGPRSGRIGFSASDRELEAGDLLLTDIAPRVNRYWGDSCATRAIGDVNEKKTRMLQVVREALELGTDAVRPGARTSEVDRMMREHVGATFPAYHNSGGHGVGLDYHEAPRLVPGEQIVLEESMIIALEPGIYLPDEAGIRLEHLVLVTPQGCEVLSGHLAAH
jgi:Xaa-Pro aminopeptidase/Xaa-Pro dipeptidase